MPLQVKNPWIYGPLHVEDIQRVAVHGAMENSSFEGILIND